jgi:hypothetical protein
MRIAMDALNEERVSVLAGVPNGRRALATLLERTSPEPTVAEAVYLDFANVEVATASFLREAVLTFRNTVRGRRSNLYPIVANANQLIMDELTLLITPYHDVLMSCCLSLEGVASKPTLIGELDPKQRLTFDLVRERGETDASELMRVYGAEERVRQTAWNNRLTALATLGLVFETSQGRAKRYRALFGEV